MNQSKPLSRRRFLLATAAVGVGTAAVASACSSDDGATDGSTPSGGAQTPTGKPTPREVGEATLKVSDAGPYKGLPDAAARKESEVDEAYAQALEEWLAANPGVTLEPISADVWNRDAMVTAISGGTAPAIFWANVIGGWNMQTIRQAFLQGLTADVTQLAAEHDLSNRMNAGAKPIWEKSWVIDGTSYAAPATYTVGEVVHYRRDLINELGLAEPEAGWTWADLRELAANLATDGRKGIIFRTGPMNAAVRTAEGMDLLSQLPAPDATWHWSYDYGIFADQWAEAGNNIRAMRFEDETAIGDVSLGNDPWEPRRAFGRGEVAMHINSVDMLTTGPAAEDGPVALAKSVGKDVGDVVGIVTIPAGIDQHAMPGSSLGSVQAVAFDPDLSEDELVAAYSLHMHMISDGLVKQQSVRYDQKGDLKFLYQASTITPVLPEIADKLPGSVAEAWGEQFVASIDTITSMPPQPAPEWFIPTEGAPGPGDQPVNDMLNKWWYDAAEPDMASDLSNVSDVRNQQAASFSSTVSADDFAAGAKEYYDAQAAHWQENSPQFYSQMFEPWYDENVKPVLG